MPQCTGSRVNDTYNWTTSWVKAWFQFMTCNSQRHLLPPTAVFSVLTIWPWPICKSRLVPTLWVAYTWQKFSAILDLISTYKAVYQNIHGHISSLGISFSVKKNTNFLHYLYIKYQPNGCVMISLNCQERLCNNEFGAIDLPYDTCSEYRNRCFSSTIFIRICFLFQVPVDR